MKKFLSLVLVALMVLPFGALATVGVSAAEEVIYVKDGATGNGSAADNALGTLAEANTLAATKTTDVTIKFVGTVNLDATAFEASYYNEPAHANKVTWTANDASSKLVVKTGTAARYYVMGGELCIKDLTIDIEGSKVLAIVTQLHDLTVDTGVTIANTNEAKAIETVVIYGLSKVDHKAYYNEDANKDVVNPSITLKSGKYKQVVGYIANFNITGEGADAPRYARYLDGKLTITISGNAWADKVYAVCNAFNVVKDCDIVLDGGTIGSYLCATDRAYDNGEVTSRDMVSFGKPSGVSGTYTLYITKNFKLADQSTLTGLASNAFIGLSGTTASPYYAGALDDANLGTYVLKADAEVYNAVDAETVKINKVTFDRVEKVEAPVTTAPSDTTAAPSDTTAPPSDTTASGTTTPPAQNNPNTGDSFVIIAVVATIAAAAIVVISKKKATR